MEEHEEMGITEGAEYSPKSEFSKPKLVYDAVQRCIEARGKEMRAGYYNTKLTKDGMPIRTWIPDTRQIYTGSVIALKSILSTEIKETSDIKKEIDKSEKEIKSTKEKYSYEELVKEREGDRIRWKKTGGKFIPEVGSMVVIQNVITPSIGEEIIGGWDSKTNLYWGIVLEEYDKMFSVINELINKKNFFKSKVSY